MMKTIASPIAACAIMCVCACASAGGAVGGGGETVNVDDVKASAPASAVARIVLCKSTYADLKVLLGEPYRDGVLHDLRVRAWKLKPEHRKDEPIAVAFFNDVVVDVCYDLPAMAKCELDYRCGDPADTEQPVRAAGGSL